MGYKFKNCNEKHDCLFTFCGKGSFWYRTSAGIYHKCLNKWGANKVDKDLTCSGCKQNPSGFTYMCLKLGINNKLKFERDVERMSTAVFETELIPYDGPVKFNPYGKVTNGPEKAKKGS